VKFVCNFRDRDAAAGIDKKQNSYPPMVGGSFEYFSSCLLFMASMVVHATVSRRKYFPSSF